MISLFGFKSIRGSTRLTLSTKTVQANSSNQPSLTIETPSRAMYLAASVLKNPRTFQGLSIALQCNKLTL